MSELIKAKIYDFNEVTVDDKKLMSWFQNTHPEFFDMYFGPNKLPAEERKKFKKQMTSMVEEAIREGLYKLTREDQISGIQERFSLDREQGYKVIIFSGISAQLTRRQLQEADISDSVDDIISLTDVVKELGLEAGLKEDPRVYQGLVLYCLKRNIIPLSYVDDKPARILGAVKGNELLAAEGKPTIKELYLFDPKQKFKEIPKGYKIIDNLMDVKA